jgi:DNA-directed RNA polymerase subunit M/transcription elongation factor TFIIS
MELLKGWKISEGTECRKCGGRNVAYRIWVSSDEAYEDSHYKCLDCDYSWWIDGPDY